MPTFACHHANMFLLKFGLISNLLFLATKTFGLAKNLDSNITTLKIEKGQKQS